MARADAPEAKEEAVMAAENLFKIKPGRTKCILRMILEAMFLWELLVLTYMQTGHHVSGPGVSTLEFILTRHFVNDCKEEINI